MPECIELDTVNGGKQFDFIDYKVLIAIDNISTNGKPGHINGELSVQTPYGKPILSQTREMLTDSSTRRKLTLTLAETVWETYIPWAEIIDYTFSQCIKYYRRGPEITSINSTDESDPIKFDLEPILLTDLPTTIYSDGGAGKSITALALAVCLRLPWHNNPFGFKIHNSSVSNNICWLDWETSKKVFQRRLRNFANGMELGYVDINYVFCEHNLADMGDQFINEITNLNPRLTVIDSIGAACAGDLNGSEAPTKFFNSLRQIPGTKLLIFHTNKEKELYGNRFFWNFSRAAWELKSQVEANHISIALYHRKHNETPQYDPIGFKFEFDNAAETITVKRADITETPELEQGLPMRIRMRALLLNNPLTDKEIAETLGANKSSVTTILYRYNGTIFTKLSDNKWGVLTEN